MLSCEHRWVLHTECCNPPQASKWSQSQKARELASLGCKVHAAPFDAQQQVLPKAREATYSMHPIKLLHPYRNPLINMPQEFELLWYPALLIQFATAGAYTAYLSITNVAAQLYCLDCGELLIWYASFEASSLLILPYLTLENRSYRKTYALAYMLTFMLCSVAVFLAVVGNLPSMRTLDHHWLTELTSLCIINVLAVKIPTWPYSSWLLEAHAEAS